MRSAVAGVGQVYFSPGLAPSIIVTSGLALGSPIAAALALFGSAIGVSVAILAHSTRWMTEIGLDGLSAVLASVAIGGFYFVSSRQSLILAGLTSIFCVVIRPLFAGLLVRPFGPAMTFPFCISATIVILAARAMGSPTPVPERLVESPERHLAGRTDCERWTAKFAKGSDLTQAELDAISEWPDLAAQVKEITQARSVC